MVSTFTPNINLEEPARGDDVGTWDTPVNSNMTVVDLVAGGIATIPLNNSNIVLSAAQFRAKTLVFNSTLTGSVNITFPTSFTKSYEIVNACTGTSVFTITLNTTNPGVNNIGCKPGEPFDVVWDSASFRYKNLGSIGSYWDYAGSSVPNWVTACSIPPFLNCDGTAFSSVTYPALATILGGTTLPNSKGRARFTLDQGAGLISTAVFSSSLVGATGGAQTTTLSSRHLPQLVDAGHPHTLSNPTGFFGLNSGGGTFTLLSGGTHNDPSIETVVTVASNVTGITYGSSTQVGAPVVAPAYIGGLTLIRAA